MNYTRNEQLNKDLNPLLTPAMTTSLTLWLKAIWIMVFGMVLLGGITRLTGSGLSMVEWKAHTQFLPPLSQAEWERVFSIYQQSPEFIKVNFWMSLPDFKSIYLMEWFHRFWGQLTGLIMLIPLLYFTAQKNVPRTAKQKLWIIFALGGMQGFLGWFMVKSGLVDLPHVSHFRLAAHLFMALLLLTLISKEIWTLTSQSKKPEKDYPDNFKIKKKLLALTILSGVTILWGAYTAGLKAGLIYNTFPLMNGAWLPDEFFSGTTSILSTFRKITMDPGCVQFTHRLLAISTFAYALFIFIQTKSLTISSPLRKQFYIMAVLLGLQVTLGIMTILYQTPLLIASAHQANAILLFLALIKCCIVTTSPRIS